MQRLTSPPGPDFEPLLAACAAVILLLTLPVLTLVLHRSQRLVIAFVYAR